MNKITLLNDRFYSYFQEFNQNAGKDKTYLYLDYKTWRSIKTALDWVEEWDIEPDAWDNDTISLSGFGQTEVKKFVFKISDYSFGEFLYEVYKSEYYNMNATEAIKHIENNNIKDNKKENDNMFNFDFGPVKASNKIRMSPFGLAIKAEDGVWKSYNAKEDKIIDVNVFTFDATKFLYKMPVAIKDVKVGDVVIHNGDPMIVSKVDENATSIAVVDVHKGEAKNIMPTYSPFGFDFIIKVVSLIDMTGAASADAPFGNMLPFLMMSEGSDIDPMMFLFMGQNGGNAFDFKSNPMALYFLMKSGDKADNMLPLMFLMNGGKQ
jgi:hypothetical protein